MEVRYGVAEHLRSLRNAIETEYEKTDRAKVDKSWLETVIDRHYNPEKYLDEVKVDPQDFSVLFDEFTLRHKVSDVRANNNQVLKRAVMRFELFRRLIKFRILTSSVHSPVIKKVARPSTATARLMRIPTVRLYRCWSRSINGMYNFNYI